MDSRNIFDYWNTHGGFAATSQYMNDVDSSKNEMSEDELQSYDDNVIDPALIDAVTSEILRKPHVANCACGIALSKKTWTQIPLNEDGSRHCPNPRCNKIFTQIFPVMNLSALLGEKDSKPPVQIFSEHIALQNTMKVAAECLGLLKEFDRVLESDKLKASLILSQLQDLNCTDEGIVKAYRERYDVLFPSNTKKRKSGDLMQSNPGDNSLGIASSTPSYDQFSLESTIPDLLTMKDFNSDAPASSSSTGNKLQTMLSWLFTNIDKSLPNWSTENIRGIKNLIYKDVYDQFKNASSIDGYQVFEAFNKLYKSYVIKHKLTPPTNRVD